MKKFTCLSIIALILSTNSAFSQNINIPADSVTNLLCKKWEMDYAMMGGMKIGKMPGATESNYEFKKDKTFILTSNNNSPAGKGTWSYDQSKKLIRLTINGKSNVSIISLKADQLELLADTKDATPDDPMPINIFYKLSAK
jgi:hypothetical protein